MVQLLSSMVHANSITMLNLPLTTSGGTIQGDLADRTVLVSLKQYSLSALRNRAHSFSLLTALFLEPRKGSYICNFPLYTQLMFLILAAFQRAILHPGFSILPVHHYVSQFLCSPTSSFCSQHINFPFHHLLYARTRLYLPSPLHGSDWPLILQPNPNLCNTNYFNLEDG